MLTYILFIAGFFLLIKGADLLVDGSASVAKKMKISSIAIGLTVVAFGTSMPEFMVSVLASAKGNTEIAIGNILGSNISNILLILGISAIIYPLASKKNTVWKEIPLSLLAAVLVGVMASDALINGDAFSALTRIDGIILLSFFVIFLYYTYEIAKVADDKDGATVREHGILKSVLFIFGGLALLVAGGKWIVDGAVKIAELLQISQSLIGLTIVAVGTSLPELATSAVAAYKKQSDIAIGNIIGSNLFNIFWVLGVSAVIRPLPFQPSSELDILMTIAASALLFLIMFIGKRHTLERWQGGIMVAIYISYVAFLVATR